MRSEAEDTIPRRFGKSGKVRFTDDGRTQGTRGLTHICSKVDMSQFFFLCLAGLPEGKIAFCQPLAGIRLDNSLYACYDKHTGHDGDMPPEPEPKERDALC